jgi:hypothetical protein
MGIVWALSNDPATNGGTMTSSERSAEMSRRLAEATHRDEGERRAMRSELVERLVNGGLAPEQAENVAAAVSVYGDLRAALEAVRRA